MRCSALLTTSMAPSAVCNSELAVLAFSMPILMPRICASMRVPMARPAASSLAALMREPVDKRCMACDSRLSFMLMAFEATRDFTLVLITDMIVLQQVDQKVKQEPGGALPEATQKLVKVLFSVKPVADAL